MKTVSVATSSSKSNWVLEYSKDLKRQVGGRREVVPEDAFLTFALYHIPFRLHFAPGAGRGVVFFLSIFETRSVSLCSSA